MCFLRFSTLKTCFQWNRGLLTNYSTEVESTQIIKAAIELTILSWNRKMIILELFSVWYQYGNNPRDNSPHFFSPQHNLKTAKTFQL